MRFLAVLAAAAVFAAALPARAEVDVEVPAVFKAKGTMGGDIDTFRFFGVRGMTFDMKIAALKGAAVDFDLHLWSPGDISLLPTEPVDSGSKVQWKGLVLPESGWYAFTVEAEGAGDYSLSIKTKAQVLWDETTNLGVEDIDSFEFAAPEGSRLSFRYEPIEGSECLPVPTSGYFDNYEIEEQVVGTTTRGAVVTFTHGPTPVGGEVDFYVRNAEGGLAGDAFMTVKIKAPKVKPGKFDLRSSVLGREAGGETFVGALIDADGGTVAPSDEDGDLFGAAVSFPAGALESPTLVTIASTDEPPMESENDQAAGPAVDLSPSGIVFGEPVAVTLPVDPALLPYGAELADVRVLVIEEGVDPFVVDPVGFGDGAVTIATTGFSICIPIVGIGPPALGLNPGGDEYWFLQWSAQMGSGSPDSRYRDIGVFVGEFSLFSDGTFQHSANQRGTIWQNSDSGGNPPIDGTRNRYQQAQEGTLAWTYHSSGRSLVLSGGEESLPTFRVSRDGRYMCGMQEGNDDSEEAFFVVKKHTGALQLDTVAGTWHLMLYEMGVNGDNSTGAAYAGLNRATGTFTFDGEGNCAIAFTSRELEFQNGSFTDGIESGSIQATYTVPGDGTVVVSLPVPDEEPEVFVLYPGDGLDAMVGQHFDIVADPPVGLVLIRQSTNASRALLNGDYHGSEFAMDPQTYTTPTATNALIGDFTASAAFLAAPFTGGASVTISWNRHRIQRDSLQLDGVRDDTEFEEFTVGVAVTKQGKLLLSAGDGGLDGAVTRDGQVVVGVSRVADDGAEFGFHVLMRAPPLNE